MTEQDERNLEAARFLYSSEQTENVVIAPDIVWHVPGHNPVSGEYRGYQAYSQVMPARMAPLSRWDFTLEEIMVNGNYVVTIFHLQGERKGVSVNLLGSHILRFNEHGKIVEGWGFTKDQDKLDEFFSA